MRLALSDADAALRDELRQFFSTEIPAEIRERARNEQMHYPDDIVTTQRILNKAGLAVPHWPVEAGGKDWTPLQRQIWADEMQLASVPEPRCEPGVPEGSQGADGRAVLTQLAVVLRRSAAQALMFERSLRLAGELRTQLANVAAGASPALAAEFRAADLALTGVTARATMHQHESARTEQWAQALLTPAGETPQDAMPAGSPEALPEEVFPSSR